MQALMQALEVLTRGCMHCNRSAPVKRDAMLLLLLCQAPQELCAQETTWSGAQAGIGRALGGGRTTARCTSNAPGWLLEAREACA